MATKREILRLAKNYILAQQALNDQTYKHAVEVKTIQTLLKSRTALWALINQEFPDEAAKPLSDQPSP